MKFLAALLLCASVCVAQTTRPNSGGGPQINADRTVTFSVLAPKAQQVSLNGDWANNAVNMTKNDQGTWSVTVGPLEPGLAIYNFVVDGLAIADPINPRMKLRAQTSASIVNVPGDGTESFAVRDVPHGLVGIQWHVAKTLDGQTREFRVYTPPGYDDNAAVRYPVMYLLHGTNDTAAGWTDVGQANFILDNMLADKKAVPMIIVMPWGHAAPYGRAGGAGGNNNAMFQKYLLEDVIPLVDKTYRVLPGRENRALVGLSMGGEQALSIGLSHLDLFATVGAFSPSIPRNAATTLKATLDGGSKSNAMLKLVWIGCGKQEPRFGSNEQFVKLLADHEIKSTFVGLDGLHNYTLWRKFLTQMAPLMFREGSTPK